MIDVSIEWGRLRRLANAIESDASTSLALYQIYAALSPNGGKKSLVYIGYVSEQSFGVRVGQHLGSGQLGARLDALGVKEESLAVRLGSVRSYGGETTPTQAILADVEGALIRHHQPRLNVQGKNSWYGRPDTNSSPLTITNSGIVGSLSRRFTIHPDG
jgi:hypothetical protein